ncbi:hypothetical protein [Furfurilactobacillus entadae]|uniref:hypothetical protein n=1 Tax=Furfurilactobacillus entadae TaxID=2922307 RepID=UPI0035EE8814
MNMSDYEQQIINSDKTAVLQVADGWYLADQGLYWPGWTYNEEDFIKDTVTITARLSKARHFNFDDEQDGFYIFAKSIAKNFPHSKFVSVSIKIDDGSIFNPDPE